MRHELGEDRPGLQRLACARFRGGRADPHFEEQVTEEFYRHGRSPSSYESMKILFGTTNKEIVRGWDAERLNHLVPAQTLLFVDNKTIIQKDDLLGQLIESSKQVKIETKTVLSELTGEIFIKEEFNNNVVWVLSGKLFNLPLNAYLNNTLNNSVDKSLNNSLNES